LRVKKQNIMVLGIIPARFGSSRFPGKPLVEIDGVPMIQRVFRQALQAKSLDLVVVATDHEGIAASAGQLGKAIITHTPHVSGTDRCAEIAAMYPEATIIVNIQGDEPYIQPEQIDLAVKTLQNNASCAVATLAKKITDAASLDRSDVVKVVFSKNTGEALYFSRHSIPFARNVAPEQRLENIDYYKHIGLYVYRQEALQKIAGFTPSPLETAESLEQLRWLENGLRIAVGITELETISIDTPEDVIKCANLLMC
jgi:3-deoxy-manno-octulosonate cytidylyltransferase (CMP-KDO synthetase)